MVLSVKDDLIVALATPSGRGQRAVIRLSGRNSFDFIEKFAAGVNKKCNSRSVIKSTLNLNEGDWDIKIPIFLYMQKGPSTYTAEDIVEIHLPGAFPLAERIIKNICHEGCRLAQPGEFTMRAFLNGRIDLLQAEAVENIISTSSESERKAAFSRIEGSLSSRISNWRDKLIEISAQIEGDLDFEQHEVSEVPYNFIKKELQRLISEIDQIYNAYSISNSSHGYITVSFLGPTNAGKSSIINALLGSNKAVVSPERTTTRDFVDYELFIEPIHFILQDCPGYDDAPDFFAEMAKERSRSAGEIANIIVLTFDLSTSIAEGLDCFLSDLPDVPLIIAGNKSDLHVKSDLKIVKERISKMLSVKGFKNRVSADICLSAKCNINISNLKKLFVDLAVNRLEGSAGKESLNLRAQEELFLARKSISNVLGIIDNEPFLELIADDLRESYRALGHISGMGYAEEVLESIFSQFCIGK